MGLGKRVQGMAFRWSILRTGDPRQSLLVASRKCPYLLP
ncbi:hypothetical protein FHS36_000243 [Streptomyces eurocidicus]|uniref:Uncharacterized protein n=1 Tax=Streptomyces eurocidicus TaxID=66423 RepID=A0A7W8B4V9_STREU|nr:hypothetical protein [Streptomyces eurocidicus]